MAKNVARGYRNIVLVGMPGSGKSTFAKSYAHLTRRSFLDFDRYLERFAGKTIPEIFSSEGEEVFRSLEQKCLRKMERRQHHVIALGGGTACNAENLELARNLGLVVFLETPVDILASRIFPEKETRPLFADTQNIEETLERVQELWNKRKEWYEQADVFLQTGFSSIDNLKLQLGAHEQRAFNRDYQRDLAAIIGENTNSSASFNRRNPTEWSPVSDEFAAAPQGNEATDAGSESAQSQYSDSRSAAPARSAGRTGSDFFMEVFSLEDTAGMGTKFGFGKADSRRFSKNDSRNRKPREPRDRNLPRPEFAPQGKKGGYVPGYTKQNSEENAPPVSLENALPDSAVQEPIQSLVGGEQNQPVGEQEAHQTAPQFPRRAPSDGPAHRRNHHAPEGQPARGPGGARSPQGARPSQPRGPGPRPGSRPFSPRPERGGERGAAGFSRPDRPERAPSDRPDFRALRQPFERTPGDGVPTERPERSQDRGPERGPRQQFQRGPRRGNAEGGSGGSAGPSAGAGGGGGSRDGRGEVREGREPRGQRPPPREGGYRPPNAGQGAQPQQRREPREPREPRPANNGGPVVPAFPKKREPESGGE